MTTKDEPDAARLYEDAKRYNWRDNPGDATLAYSLFASAVRLGHMKAKSKLAEMMFAGAGGRPVTIKEYADDDGRALRVETNYGKDQILGDVPGVIGVPVSADDTMHIDATTPRSWNTIWSRKVISRLQAPRRSQGWHATPPPERKTKWRPSASTTVST